MKKMIDRLKKKFLKRKCKHLNKKEVFRYYPDSYIIFKCMDCGEEIYEEL